MFYLKLAPLTCLPTLREISDPFSDDFLGPERFQ